MWPSGLPISGNALRDTVGPSCLPVSAFSSFVPCSKMQNYSFNGKMY